MLIEGRGDVPPGHVIIRLSTGDIAYLREIADRRDAFRRYTERRDAWGRGFVKRPVHIGLAGEHALCVYLRRVPCKLSVDSRLLPKGDQGRDLESDGIIFQVKTARGGNGNLIRRVDERHRLHAFACSVFVFCKWGGAGVVRLKGWITAFEASNRGTMGRSRVAPHWNLQIADRDLLPMNRLVDEIRARRLP